MFTAGIMLACVDTEEPVGERKQPQAEPAFSTTGGSGTTGTQTGSDGGTGYGDNGDGGPGWIGERYERVMDGPSVVCETQYSTRGEASSLLCPACDWAYDVSARVVIDPCGTGEDRSYTIGAQLDAYSYNGSLYDLIMYFDGVNWVRWAFAPSDVSEFGYTIYHSHIVPIDDGEYEVWGGVGYYQ